ncbi:Multidrug resistance protein B [Methanosarcina sp. MTP4]|uniref:MFS transporter n=1 Tax=Methanosarcina sp. MTP4 TaxID=1434100 RepID=UPI00061587E3|nr:MFS transporter [Methanosarcina sp. MTP4]AKB24135.1 Multidrug resistance protein B [Methanosarcina sp. MTP4]
MNPDRFLIYTTVLTIMGLSNAVIPILPELAAQDHSSFGAFASSLLFSAYFLGALATMLPFGILSDRFGNLRFIGLGILLTAGSGLIILLSENLWVLLLARFVEGSACGAFFPAAFSTLSEYRNPGRYMGEFTFLLNAGLAAGTLFSGLLAETHLKGAIFIFTFMSFLLILLILPRNRELKSPGQAGKKTTENRSVVNSTTGNRNTEKRNTGNRNTGNRPDSFSDPFKSAFGTLTAVFRGRNSRILLLSMLLNGGIGILIAYYPDYSANFLTKAQLGSSIASLYICAMITSLLIGRFSIGERTMIRIGIAFSALGAFLAIQYPFPGFSCLGGGSGIAIVGFSLAFARMDIDRGLAMGLFNTTIYAGLSLAPITAGLFTGVLSLEEIFLANGCILTGAFFLKE